MVKEEQYPEWSLETNFVDNEFSCHTLDRSPFVAEWFLILCKIVSVFPLFPPTWTTVAEATVILHFDVMFMDDTET